MPVGSISSSSDTVGVAVVNYRVPVLESREEILQNCRRIAEFVKGSKMGYPGLDLIIFPEYSTQGFHPEKWEELSTTVPGPETEIFSEACRENKVWGVFSITGEINVKGNPFNSFILIDDEGKIRMNYHKINPWVPKEPWYPGEETMVVEGPKGLKIGANICYDSNLPEIVRDTVYSYFGHSNIVNFDGSTLAECGTAPDEVTYAELSLSAIRNARKTWTAENHLYNMTHRGYTAIAEGVATNPYVRV